LQLCGRDDTGSPVALNMQTLCVGSWSWKAIMDDLEQAETPRFRRLCLDGSRAEQGAQHADGSPSDVLASLWLERTPEGRIARVHGSVLGPHARGEFEALSGRASQLEHLKKLAGELAHDFNNLLTIILSVSELMLVSGDLSSGLKRRARALVSASQRAATLATQLLSLSRGPQGPQEDVPTHVFVQDALDQARRLIPELEARTQIAADAGSIQVDTTQLAQVLINLVIHVRDSLPNDDAVGICSQRIQLDDPPVSTLKPGAYVQISIGPASDLELSLADADPTRTQPAAADIGRTSGLGLTSAHGVVRGAGGYIGIGRGHGGAPLFTLYLPLVAPTHSLPPEADRNAPAMTVLVAEDEHLVRQLTCALLREEGYEVIEAADGQSALQLASRYPGNIDLLLTDVTMPLMGGVELGRELQKIYPGLAVLYMSGHSEDALLRQGLPKREAHLLAKPFSRSALTSAVKRMLQQARVAELPSA
jgi:CheY-like chemotaxis protein